LLEVLCSLLLLTGQGTLPFTLRAVMAEATCDKRSKLCICQICKCGFVFYLRSSLAQGCYCYCCLTYSTVMCRPNRPAAIAVRPTCKLHILLTAPV